ncbi:hypothetical protein [Thioalkalivibrio sp. HL-Eb18]|uniref:hypothetical protein n=1 Tax=Thioalkalivibrio sp. HL-Eb18 TaxID=1266913 RepID=UPI000371FE1F|nr:hypothetical protein [Thioalkalivibrio sp. HL-Eb18]
MTTNLNCEPIRLGLNLAADEWDTDMADLAAAFRRGLSPQPDLAPEAYRVLDSLRASICATSDADLAALAALIQEDPMAARLRLLDAIQETETAARKTAAN